MRSYLPLTLAALALACGEDPEPFNLRWPDKAPAADEPDGEEPVEPEPDGEEPVEPEPEPDLPSEELEEFEPFDRAAIDDITFNWIPSSAVVTVLDEHDQIIGRLQILYEPDFVRVFAWYQDGWGHVDVDADTREHAIGARSTLPAEVLAERALAITLEIQDHYGPNGWSKCAWSAALAATSCAATVADGSEPTEECSIDAGSSACYCVSDFTAKYGYDAC